MSDKEKELNNKPTDDRQSSDLKIEFKPSDSKDPSFVVKKTPEQIKIENSESVPEQSSLDINANLGSFGTPEPIVDKTLSTTNISALEKIQEKNDEIAITDDKDSKINFNKFENRQEKKSRTKFGARFDIWLRKPKILLRIWLIAIALIAIILAGDIVYLVFVTKLLKESPLGSKPYHAEGVVGNIFSYIAVSLPVVPFVFLLTTAIIGINGMLSSKMFHYFLWSFLIAAFVCFLMATILSGYYMDMSYSFHAPK